MNIIPKEETLYASTYPNLFYKGRFNPLDKRTLIKSVVVNSKFRSNYYNTLSSDFLFEFPLEFKNVVSLRVTDIQIPVQLYNISNYLGNNYFLIKNETSLDVKKIIIPDGFYSNKSLIDVINNIFGNFTDEFKFIFFAINGEGGNGETVVALMDTAPYIFNFTLEFNTDFIENIFSDTKSVKYNNTNLMTKLGWILGFRFNHYDTKSVYVSEGLIETQLSTIFLCINDFNDNQFNNKFNVFNNKSLLSNDIVSQIYVSNKTSVNSITKTYFGGTNLTKIHIRLIDSFGKIIDLNNNDFNFTIQLEMIYDL
jgi:hypothetical protein